MALDAKHRSSIYDKLVPLLGEDNANALMSQYLESNEVVTKDHLQAELALVRSELREEISTFRGEVREEFAAVRGEVREEFAAVRGELRSEIAGIRVEIADGFRRQQAWLVATIAAATAVLGTLTSVF